MKGHLRKGIRRNISRIMNSKKGRRRKSSKEQDKLMDIFERNEEESLKNEINNGIIPSHENLMKIEKSVRNIETRWKEIYGEKDRSIYEVNGEKNSGQNERRLKVEKVERRKQTLVVENGMMNAEKKTEAHKNKGTKKEEILSLLRVKNWIFNASNQRMRFLREENGSCSLKVMLIKYIQFKKKFIQITIIFSTGT
jgi:hypothetical protein